MTTNTAIPVGVAIILNFILGVLVIKLVILYKQQQELATKWKQRASATFFGANPRFRPAVHGGKQ
jgi:hypothetical protein